MMERRIVADLVEVFMADDPRPSSALESVFLDDWNYAADDNARPRRIDQVASLTDTSALVFHFCFAGRADKRQPKQLVLFPLPGAAAGCDARSRSWPNGLDRAVRCMRRHNLWGTLVI